VPGQVSLHSGNHDWARKIIFKKYYLGQNIYWDKAMNTLEFRLALRVENVSEVDKFYERLSGLSAEKIESPQNRPWGHRSFVIHDPDQIPIHVYCELK
jgi:uncharacterized glyoxalase superfamily protein PhnB